MSARTAEHQDKPVAGTKLRAVQSLEVAASKDPRQTVIPEGEYEVAFLRWEQGKAFGSRLTWFGHFKVVELGDYFGEPLVRYWNAPNKTIARNSNLGLDYMAVVGRRPPSTGLKPHMFLTNCTVRAKIVMVKTNSRSTDELPEECWYSKIDQITGLLNGTPPCLQSRRHKP